MRARTATAAALALACPLALACCSPVEPEPEPIEVTISIDPDDPAAGSPTSDPTAVATITLAVDGEPVEASWLGQALCSTTDDRLSFAAATQDSSISGEIALADAPSLRAVVYTIGATAYTSDLVDPGTVVLDGGRYGIETTVVRHDGGDARQLALTLTCG